MEEEEDDDDEVYWHAYPLEGDLHNHPIAYAITWIQWYGNKMRYSWMFRPKGVQKKNGGYNRMDKVKSKLILMPHREGQI